MKKLTSAALMLTALSALASCASPGSGQTYHTLYTGDGTRSPETVYVTLPAETVIITVPVIITETPDTGTPGTVSGLDTFPVTEPKTETVAPETVSDPITVKTVTAVKDLGGGSKATLRYPEIGGLKSESVMTKLNSQLAVIAEYDFIADEHCKDYADRIAEGKKVNYTVNECDVTKVTGLLISVRWTAEYSIDGGDPALLLFTHYMNISTGKEIKAKDIFSDFAKILDLLESGKMTRIYASDGFDASVDMTAVIKQYRAGIAYNTYPATYVTGDKLVIAVTAGGSNGGYAEYSVPLSDVSAYLKIAF